MDKSDIIMHKGLAWVWLALLIGCTVAVVFFGAYHHIFTGAIAWIMYSCCKGEAKRLESDESVTK